MENVSSFVFDFFMERHIALKEEWLSNVLEFLFAFIETETGESAFENLQIIAGLVYEQWKYTNIADTTYPLLKQLALAGDMPKAVVNQPVVLQITSIIDIGASFYSQFCALVHEFVDNTGFEPLPEMERGTGLEDLEAKPRRMLCFTVTDGETILRAIEYHSIKNFSLLTKPGCKIVLIPPILFRKGVLLLKPKNVQLLGGDVESFFCDGRPLEVMSKKLNLPIPTSIKQSVSAHTQSFLSDKFGESDAKEKAQNSRTPVHYDVVDKSESNFKAEGSVVNSVCREVNVHGSAEVLRKPRTKSCGSSSTRLEDSSLTTMTGSRVLYMSESSSRACSKPVAQVSPMHSTDLYRRDIQNRRSPIPLEESPPDFDAELGRLQTTIRSSSPYRISEEDKFRQHWSNRRAENPSILSICSSQSSTFAVKETPRVFWRRNTMLGARGHLQRNSPLTKRQGYVNESAPDFSNKKVKHEVIELDDEEDVKPNKLGSLLASPSLRSPSVTEPLKTAQNPHEDDIVVKFQALNVVHIAEALKQMRFAVGSCRKTIQGIIVDIVDPLRIVDDLWTMKVTIDDVSSNGFMCSIDSYTLSSLIGLTPKQAMEIRASHDMDRRQDGQRRLAAVEEQLKRLDLLIDVELFSGGRADPVIRNIRTFMQALSM